MAAKKTSKRGHEPERNATSELRSTGWLDLLARLENEMERKEEAWRNQQQDPHNIATAVMVACAEVKSALRTAIAESVSRSNAMLNHGER